MMPRSRMYRMATCGVILLGAAPLLQAAENPRQEIQRQLIAQTDLQRQVPQFPEAEPAGPAEVETTRVEDDPLLLSADQTAFPLSRINFTGNTVIPTPELETFAEEFLKGRKEVTLNDLKRLAHELTKLYRSKGYVTSRAFVPVQTAERGEVEIRVMEGKLSEVVVRGNRYHSKEYYADRIGVKKNDLLFYPKLREELARLNTQDRKVQAYLNPTEDPQYFDTVLDVSEVFPVHAFYNFNNYGTNLTHLERHNVTVYHNSLTGHDDRLYGSWTLSEQATVGGWNMGYSFPIIKTGTRLSLLSSLVQSQLGKSYRQYKIRGDYWSLTPGIEQDFWNTGKIKWSGYSHFEIKDSRSSIDEATTSFDRTRVLVGGTRVQSRDRLGFNWFDVAVHQGIPDFLGSSGPNDPHASREGTGGEFTYFTGALKRIQRLPWQIVWTERAEGFVSCSKLITLEQNRLGGSQSVRGYPEADVLGDGGFLVSSEISMPVYGLPKMLQMPTIHKSLPLDIRLIGFLDLGKSYLMERNYPEQEKDKLLMGTGFGVRANVGQNISMVMDLGFPFGDKSTDKDHPQLHLSVTAGL